MSLSNSCCNATSSWPAEGLYFCVQLSVGSPLGPVSFTIITGQRVGPMLMRGPFGSEAGAEKSCEPGG